MLLKKKSKIHGFGIFTDFLIKKGSSFYKIPKEEIIDYPKKRCAYIGNGKWVCDRKVLNWVNHSCNPNCVLDLTRKCLISAKDINSGEEITLDYNKTEHGNIKIKCKCNAENCKGYFLIR
jgi:SET domain-containing protein